MRFIHLETVELRNKVFVRPMGRLGTCGPVVGGGDLMWQGVYVTKRQAKDHHKIRAAWNTVNPSLIAGSINAPAIEAKE